MTDRIVGSQVNALLHVLRGLHKDVLAAYPALEGSLSKDFERIALLCRERGLVTFTLDLPHLESLLLSALESGRLSLYGPLSQRVSHRIQVPRLYSGLWLRVFDIRGRLFEAHEVDVTALAFLRQLLVIGKKLEVECSDDRVFATVGAYHDIERQLRSPSLDWLGDELGLARGERLSLSGYLHCRDHYLDFLRSEEEEAKETVIEGEYRRLVPPMHINLVDALEWVHVDNVATPLFREELTEEVVATKRGDASLLSKIQQVADLIIGSFVPLEPMAFSSYLESRGLGIGFKHGPGAVAERLKNWEKSHFPNWPLKLQRTFPFEFCGTVAAGKEGQELPLNHEVASRLIKVPKTVKSPRLIAAEPTSHQWCQQLVLRYLFDQCRTHFGTAFIDFKDQSKSGDMVLDASRNRELATVDLSDASDRLSCWTVERVFRSNPSILTALHAARTRYLRDEISEDKGFLSLKKFASQGTATTFPVMSLVMLCIALGSTLGDEQVTWHNIRKYRTKVRVFGDDIILPAHGYERLVRAMILLQLKVNVAKSYVTGYFRESCGTDGYLGYDVTPVKPKVLVAGSPASCQAVVDNSNNLYLKGYWNASTACIDLLPARLRRGIRIVGPHDVGFRGVTSYSGGHESHLRKRWNSRLHRHEVRVWTLSVRTEEHPRDGLPALLDFFASKHNHEHARIVSEYADVRKTRIGLLWEPANYHGRFNDGPSGERSLADDARSNRVFVSKLGYIQRGEFHVDRDEDVS